MREIDYDGPRPDAVTVKDYLENTVDGIDFRVRGDRFVIAETSPFVGANITFEDAHHMEVAASFPRWYTMLAFAALVLLLGIVLPLLVYFLTLYRKQCDVERRVAEALQDHYGAPDTS